MSMRLPESVDHTARIVPAADSRMPRISSMSGPGQKLPRASIVRVSCSVASPVISMPSFSDDEGGIRLGPDLDGRRGARRLTHLVDEVLALEAEHVHGHLAWDEFDAHGGRCLKQLTRARDVVLLAKGAHHPRAHPHEIHLAELQVIDPWTLHERQHLLHPVVTDDPLVVLDERQQSPERDEDSAPYAARGCGRRQDQYRPDLVEVT